MTVWIQPTEALAEQLDIPPVPLPVAESTAADLQAGTVDVGSIARDIDDFLGGSDPNDQSTMALRRCAAALALAAANGDTDDGDHGEASRLLRLAVRHAPDDVGIRAAYGSALWMSGDRFGGLAQLTDAVGRNKVQGRLVPMLWVLTARAMADAGRHGDALLLLEDLAVTGPTNFRFWELIDSIDARASGVAGGYRPADAEATRVHLGEAVVGASATFDDARSAVNSLGVAAADPVGAPLLSLEVTDSSASSTRRSGRPGTLALFDASVAVVSCAESAAAPTPARSTVELAVWSGPEVANATVAVGIDGAADPVVAESVLQASARVVAAFPASRQQPSASFAHVLDAPSSLALAAILDVVESAVLNGVPPSGLPVSALVEYALATSGLGMRAGVLAMINSTPGAAEVVSALTELSRLGFLEIDSSSVRPLPFFVYLMSGVGPSLSWRRVTHHDTHARSLSRRRWTSTPAGILRLAPSGEGGVSWRIIQRNGLQGELAVELAVIAG